MWQQSCSALSLVLTETDNRLVQTTTRANSASFPQRDGREMCRDSGNFLWPGRQPLVLCRTRDALQILRAQKVDGLRKEIMHLAYTSLWYINGILYRYG